MYYVMNFEKENLYRGYRTIQGDEDNMQATAIKSRINTNIMYVSGAKLSNLYAYIFKHLSFSNGLTSWLLSSSCYYTLWDRTVCLLRLHQEPVVF